MGSPFPIARALVSPPSAQAPERGIAGVGQPDHNDSTIPLKLGDLCNVGCSAAVAAALAETAACWHLLLLSSARDHPLLTGTMVWPGVCRAPSGSSVTWTGSRL